MSTPRKTNPTTAVLNEIRTRRQNLGGLFEAGTPLLGGNVPERGRKHYAEEGEKWTGWGANRLHHGYDGYDAHLLANLYLALAEEDEAEARALLVDMAAIAVLAIEGLGGEGK